MENTLFLTIILGYFVVVGLVAELFFRTAIRRSARDTYQIHGFNNAGIAFPVVVMIYVIHAFTLFPVQLPFFLVGWVIRKIAGFFVRMNQARAQRAYEAVVRLNSVPAPIECVPVPQNTLARLIEAASEGILTPGGTTSETIASAILASFDVTYRNNPVTDGALPDDDFEDEDREEDNR